VNRAERRRLEREQGRHRAPTKRGRRSALRGIPTPPAPAFPTLERSGFQIARPRLEVPHGNT